MSPNDYLGERGEALFRTLISRAIGRTTPLFGIPRHLGEKAQTLDFLVETLDRRQVVRGYFFVQVKATLQGLTQARKNEPRLRVSVKGRDVRRLRAYPGPTYVIGLDARPEVERGYILSMNEGPLRKRSSLPTRHPFEGDNLELLWKEVSDFWANRDMLLRNSHFSDPG